MQSRCLVQATFPRVSILLGRRGGSGRFGKQAVAKGRRSPGWVLCPRAIASARAV